MAINGDVLILSVCGLAIAIAAIFAPGLPESTRNSALIGGTGVLGAAGGAAGIGKSPRQQINARSVNTVESED